jgi:hypothetical protein
MLIYKTDLFNYIRQVMASNGSQKERKESYFAVQIYILYAVE